MSDDVLISGITTWTHGKSVASERPIVVEWRC
jgi:hypothetical protein